MKSVLYIMNESWFWIKQRPHFIAEYLSEYYHTDVFCEKRFTKLVDNEVPTNLRIKNIFKFPFAHNNIVRGINKFLHKHILFPKYFKNIEKKYDIIWLNDPKHFSYIRRFIGNEKMVVYDCMDDLLEFQGSKKNSKIYDVLFSQEKNLFDRCNIVFCSSETLKEKLCKRYGKKDNIFVINNAIYINDFDSDKEKIPDELLNIFKINKKTLCYFGAVSEWFDFEILSKCLENFKDIGILLVGPSDVKIPTADRLYIYPPVKHNLVLKLLKKADALIMPFKITELVKSVNPVKLYEYIYGCVPSIIVSYPESDKFKDYIYLYNEYQDFHKYIELLISNKLLLKKPEEDYINFALQNSWEKRITEILFHLNKV